MEIFQPDNVLIQPERVGLQRLRWLSRAVSAGYDDLMTYSAADFAWLTHLLGTVADPSNYGTLSMVAELEDFVELRLRDGGILPGLQKISDDEPLPGLQETTDSGGAPRWEFVGEHGHPICREPEPSEQRAFVEHYWLAILAQELVGFIAELKPEQALELKPGVLAQLEQLSPILVALDRINSDESRPFIERLDPQVDLFCDISYDVLSRRLAAARATVEQERGQAGAVDAESIVVTGPGFSTGQAGATGSQLSEEDSPV